jgi:serine-type D-Ala-D-Ala carboxypeptidase
MPHDFSAVDVVIRVALERVFPSAQVVVLHTGQVQFAASYGWLDPETRRQPVNADTLFDLASVTKLFTVTAFMALVEAGRVGLDQAVQTVLPGFGGSRPIRPYEDPLAPGRWVQVETGTEAAEVDASAVTFRHLLTHTSGLPAWRPLYREPSPDAARRMALGTFFSYPVGSRTVYSDIGLILLGLSIEWLTGLPLDQAIARLVTDPLGLHQTRFLPVGGTVTVQAAPTEECRWRGRRIVGEVHDENAAGLGGVAGHAGLFSTAEDVARLGQMYLERGRPILQPSTVAEMTRLQAQDGDVRRGLGFALWSPDPEASGNAFGPAAFGHTGFTGTSLWIDPSRELVVAVMTNRVYYGRDAGGILAFRVSLHRAIVEAVDVR